MKCTHEQYLESEELQCRRIADSCNSGTQSQDEWLKTAAALLVRRREHILVCHKCSKGK